MGETFSYSVRTFPKNSTIDPRFFVELRWYLLLFRWIRGVSVHWSAVHALQQSLQPLGRCSYICMVGYQVLLLFSSAKGSLHRATKHAMCSWPFNLSSSCASFTNRRLHSLLRMCIVLTTTSCLLNLPAYTKPYNSIQTWPNLYGKSQAELKVSGYP